MSEALIESSIKENRGPVSRPAPAPERRGGEILNKAEPFITAVPGHMDGAALLKRRHV